MAQQPVPVGALRRGALGLPVSTAPSNFSGQPPEIMGSSDSHMNVSTPRAGTLGTMSVRCAGT